MFLGMAVVLSLFFGSFCSASEGAGAPKAYAVEINRPTAVESMSLESNSVDKTKCLLLGGFRRYYYGYYYPRIYYYPVYRPTYYYDYSYYCYSYVTFYKGLDNTEEIGLRGLRMEDNPAPDTALAKLGVKKGNIITEIDGVPVKSEKDMNKVTENSKLTVLKGDSESGSASGDTARHQSRSGKAFAKWFSE